MRATCRRKCSELRGGMGCRDPRRDLGRSRQNSSNTAVRTGTRGFVDERVGRSRYWCGLVVGLAACADPEVQPTIDAYVIDRLGDDDGPAFDVTIDAPWGDATLRDAGITDASGVDVRDVLPRDVPPRDAWSRPDVYPADPCASGAFVDLDLEGIRTRSEIRYEGETFTAAEELGSGPTPSCCARPRRPRMMRWTMRRRGILEINATRFSSTPVHLVAWAATTCSTDAESLGCTVSRIAPTFSAVPFVTRVLDAGTPVWIGVAIAPALRDPATPEVTAFTVTLTERAPPATGTACNAGTEGPICPPDHHCLSDTIHLSRCRQDGLAGNRCREGLRCDEGLVCVTRYGSRTCRPVLTEGQRCSSSSMQCPPGTWCAPDNFGVDRCLRGRSDGSPCAPAPDREGVCDAGLACNSDIHSSWVRSPDYPFSYVVPVCRPAVGIGEVCGRELRRPCGAGLTCRTEGNTSRCVPAPPPADRACSVDLFGIDCPNGMLCRSGRCVEVGGGGDVCEGDRDCQPSLRCLRGACALLAASGESCGVSPGCGEGEECVTSPAGSVCARRGSVGTACRETWPPCEDGLMCRSNRCVAGPCEGADAGCSAPAIVPQCEQGRLGWPAASDCPREWMCTGEGWLCWSPSGSVSEGRCRGNYDCPAPQVCIGTHVCSIPGSVGGPCMPGPVPCRDEVQCSYHPSDGSLICDNGFGGDGSVGSICGVHSDCADDLFCWDACHALGVLNSPCRAEGPRGACDDGLRCAWGVCVRALSTGSRCGGLSPGECPPGESCGLIGGESRCVVPGVLGGACPCAAGLFCNGDFCATPMRVGDYCRIESTVCGPGLGCIGTPTDARCARSGMADGPCRERSPYCDDGLLCNGGICRRVSRVGEPCTSRCSLDASCVGTGAVSRCVRFGTEGGLCRRTPGDPPCDAPLRCSAAGSCER